MSHTRRVNALTQLAYLCGPQDPATPTDHHDEPLPLTTLAQYAAYASVYAALKHQEDTPDDAVVDTSERLTGEAADAIESEGPLDAVSTMRTRLYAAFDQTHLPMLDNYGVITYDDTRKTVQRGPNFECVAPYLPIPAANDTNEETGTWPGADWLRGYWRPLAIGLSIAVVLLQSLWSTLPLVVQILATGWLLLVLGGALVRTHRGAEAVEPPENATAATHPYWRVHWDFSRP